MTEAVSYLRVSSEGQISGDGFPRQREKIFSYASANSFTLLEEFRDEGVTGKMEIEGRGGLSACIEYVRTNNVKVVLIEDSTRLARDMIVAEVVVREFQKIGVRVISASGGVDLTAGDDSNPTAKLIRQILAAVAEFDRCCINIRMRGGRDRKRRETGKCEGQKSYGQFKIKDDDPASVLKAEQEKKTLHTIRSLRASGVSCDKIAEALNTNGVATRKGGPWIGATVNRILKREEA